MREAEFITSVMAGALLPVSVVFLECIFAFSLRYRIKIYHILFTAAGPAAVGAICLLIPSVPARYILQGVFLVAILALYLSQFVYYRIFQTLFITQSLKGAGKAMQFISVAMSKVRENLGSVILFFVPSVLYFLVGFKIMSLTGQAIVVQGIFLGVILLCAVIFLILELLDTSGALSPRFLLRHAFVTEPSLRRFGLLTTMAIDVKVNVLGIVDERDPEIDLGKIRVIRTTADQIAGEKESPVVTDVRETAAQPNRIEGIFPVLQSDPAFDAMDAYFSARPTSAKNKYTGYFRGKNLILITAESFSKYLIDPVLTPTLYRMSSEGFRFNRFYTPLWGVSTSDGEFVATSGLIPKSGIWSYTKIAGHKMPFALGNQLKENGYHSYAYHNNTFTYYNRNKSYPSMGYDYKGLGNGLEVRATWPESDLEMIELSAADFAGNEPFHVYYLSVSGHMEYSFSNNFISEKNRKAVEDLPYSESVKAYIACSIELEYALAELVKRLTAAGTLENTVIAMSADHYPYGLSEKAYDELAGRVLEKNFEIYENAFLLWCADMKAPVEIDKVCSSLDIVPTLSNLFGLTYDSRLLMGTDILSSSGTTVIFQDRSFINDKLRFHAALQEIKLATQEEVSEEEIKSYVKDVSDRFKYSAKIIETDYYRHLFPDAK